jgi:hypothetical protein
VSVDAKDPTCGHCPVAVDLCGNCCAGVFAADSKSVVSVVVQPMTMLCTPSMQVPGMLQESQSKGAV